MLKIYFLNDGEFKSVMKDYANGKPVKLSKKGEPVGDSIPLDVLWMRLNPRHSLMIIGKDGYVKYNGRVCDMPLCFATRKIITCYYTHDGVIVESV